MIIRDTSFEPDNVTRKAVADLFVAMFISQLLVNTAALFDSFIVGRFFKEVCLGSTSITYQLTFFNITLGSIFGVGSQLECSFALAQGDMLRANRVFSASLVLIAVISLVLTGLLLCFTGQVASVMGASPANAELHGVTSDYIRGLAIGLPSEYLSFFLTAVLPLDGDRKRIMSASVIMIIVNIIGDLLVVYLFRSGMFGIGLATSVSNCCGVIILASHFPLKENRFRLVKAGNIFQWFGLFVRRSFSTISGRFMKWLYLAALIRIIIGLASQADLAAYSMFNNIRNIMICLCLGLGSAILLVAGTLYEEKNIRGLRQAVWTGLKYSVVLGVIIGILIAWLAGPILSLYGHNAGTEEAVLALRIYSLCFVTIFLHFFYSFYVRAIGDRFLQAWFNVFGEFLIPTASALIMGLVYGVRGIWAAFPLGSVITVVSTILIARLRNGRCKDPRDTVMLLPQRFFDGQIRCLNVSPGDAREGSQYAKKTQEFLLSQSFSLKTAISVSHCIEEAVSILYEQKEDGKAPHISLFVRIEDDCILIRARSYGRIADPFRKERDIKPMNISELATKMIQSIADRAEYNTALGVNNIIIVVNR